MEKSAAANGWKRPSGAKAAKSLPTIAALLPTPSAYESTPTPEFVEEVRENMDDPHKRLYLPDRKWHAQRTLSRIVPALLPTPVVSDGRGLTDGDSREGGASLREVDALLPTPGAWLGRRPENATADPERAASRMNPGLAGKRSIELPDALAAAGLSPLLPTPTSEDGERGKGADEARQGGSTLRGALLPTPAARDGKGANPNERDGGPDLPGAVKLLPTPVVTDAFGSRRATARTDEWESNEGTTLTDALWQVQGRTEDTRGGLLPTPTVAAGRKSTRAMTSSGAGEGNGKRDGGGMSSPPGLEQVAELQQGIWPRDLPPYEQLPPMTQEIVRSLWPGASTSPPSDDGRLFSDDGLPGQLTIEGG